MPNKGLTMTDMLNAKEHGKARVIDSIARFWTQRGYAPTVRDIANDTGIKFDTVYRYVNQLVASGHVERDKGVNRSIRLTGRAFQPHRHRTLTA